MAIEQKIVCICDICGYMVEANGDGIGCATAPDTWAHGKFGNIDVCPKCDKKLNRVNKVVHNELNRQRGFSYANQRKD